MGHREHNIKSNQCRLTTWKEDVENMLYNVVLTYRKKTQTAYFSILPQHIARRHRGEHTVQSRLNIIMERKCKTWTCAWNRNAVNLLQNPPVTVSVNCFLFCYLLLCQWTAYSATCYCVNELLILLPVTMSVNHFLFCYLLLCRWVTGHGGILLCPTELK